ncbi:MAG TPA: neutral zinc metallopeptidase [Mycobacteriales bacterium]|nr:neutral zinc metallopeptidase [Mycobacteriales bacterium]
MTFNEGIRIDPGRASGGRGGGGLAVGGGLGGIVVLVLALALGIDPSTLTGGGGGGGQVVPGDQQFAECTTAEAANTDVDCRIIATAESLDAVWAARLPQATGEQYVEPGLRIFEQQTDTGCGAATSATGPFYCPPDSTVYIDSSFFDVLTSQFGSSGGPLAQEYVVAHEFGHHIQNQLGVLGASQQDPDGADSGAVRVELQADCYAGLWAHDAATSIDPESGQTFLEPLTDADIADALSAASAVGDDRIQEQTQGRVDPEAWTHGSSAQRQLWFTTGYRTGDVAACDTFSARDLGPTG